MAILINPLRETLDHVIKSQHPYVLIDELLLYRSERRCVAWTPMAGIYDLMEYLIRDLGHQRIGLINGASKFHRSRRAAYRIGLETHGIEYDELLTRTAEVGLVKEGYDSTMELLNIPDPPTAIFVDTDLKAIGAIKAAKELNLRVPEDISIAGFDDIPQSDALDPPLTTVAVPYYEMGATAVRLLQGELGNEERVNLLTKLIVRNSCAPIPTRA